MQALPVKADLTPAEIVRIKAPTLSQLNAGTGKTLNAEAVIASMLLELMEYFGVSWSKTQATECARLWATEYYWMTAAEIKHFFTKCKKGDYTRDDFRHLSPFQLMGWLTTYTEELWVERGRLGEEKAKLERLGLDTGQGKSEQAVTEWVRDEGGNVIASPVVDVDFKKLIEAVKPAGVGVTDEEQAKLDEEFRARRDAQVKVFAQQQGIDLNQPPNDETKNVQS
jgi:hypothetical protein